MLRADSGAHAGLGHVMRSYALAQAWRDADGAVVFLSESLDSYTGRRLDQDGIAAVRLTSPPGSVEDALVTAELARKIGARWIVADGYQFGAAYQKMARTHGQNLMLIDDEGHANWYFADAILNQNLSAQPCLYENCEAATQLLLGSRYLLLRREFLAWNSWTRIFPGTAKNILVTLGGSDPLNLAPRIVHVLEQINSRDMRVLFIAGPAYPHREALAETLATSRLRYELMDSVSDMPGRMAWADLAIAAAGSTCWELAFMGVPTMAIAVASNQRPIAEHLALSGCARSWQGCNLDDTALAEEVASLIPDQGRRESMSVAGRRLIDGFGPSRVIEILMAGRTDAERD